MAELGQGRTDFGQAKEQVSGAREARRPLRRTDPKQGIRVQVSLASVIAR